MKSATLPKAAVLDLGLWVSNTRILQGRTARRQFEDHQRDWRLLSQPLLLSEYSAAVRLQTVALTDCNPEAGHI